MVRAARSLTAVLVIYRRISGSTRSQMQVRAAQNRSKTMVCQYFRSYGQNRRSRSRAEVWRALGSWYFGFSTSFKSTMLILLLFFQIVVVFWPVQALGP